MSVLFGSYSNTTPQAVSIPIFSLNFWCLGLDKALVNTSAILSFVHYTVLFDNNEAQAKSWLILAQIWRTIILFVSELQPFFGHA
jgi:hypothetical protein